jgi:excisionase family DNA binding protein
MTDANQRCMRPSDLAKHWGCSENHVRNLIKRGDLRAFRLGLRLWRIPTDAVTEYEQRQEQMLAEESAPKNPIERGFNAPHPRSHNP